MPYLFDTDTLSATLRQRPSLTVIRKLATVPPAEQFTSAINLRKLVFGAIRRDRIDLLDRPRNPDPTAGLACSSHERRITGEEDRVY